MEKEQTKTPRECRLCGWRWEARVEHPAQCPRCKRYDWEAPLRPQEPVHA